MHPINSDAEVPFSKIELNTQTNTTITALVKYPGPPDTFISGHKDGKIRAWCRGDKLKTLTTAHTKPITSLAVFRDCRLISASLDNTIEIWDGAGLCTARINMTLPPITNLSISSIKSLAASQNNNWFAASVVRSDYPNLDLIYIYDSHNSISPYEVARKDSPLIATDNKLIFIDPDNKIVIHDIATKVTQTLYALKLLNHHSIAGLSLFQ